MKNKPIGYHVLIDMEGVENTITEGPLAGFQKASTQEHEREQGGHDVGTIVAFGPLVFADYAGCDAETPEGRAAQWGCKIGDKVLFERYEGKLLRVDGCENLRLITDSRMKMVIGDDK